MDLETELSKTAEGLREAGSRGRKLGELRKRILLAVDGKATIARIAERAGVAPEEALRECEELERAGYVRVVVHQDLGSGSGGTLDFTPGARRT